MTLKQTFTTTKFLKLLGLGFPCLTNRGVDDMPKTLEGVQNYKTVYMSMISHAERKA